MQGVVAVYITISQTGVLMNYTYLLRCADSSLYCGWTNQLNRRVQTHNAGKGAKYTRSRRPVSLVYYEVFETKEEAMRREYAIKRLSKAEKEALVAAFGQSRSRQAE